MKIVALILSPIIGIVLIQFGMVQSILAAGKTLGEAVGWTMIFSIFFAPTAYFVLFGALGVTIILQHKLDAARTKFVLMSAPIAPLVMSLFVAALQTRQAGNGVGLVDLFMAFVFAGLGTNGAYLLLTAYSKPRAAAR